jgi:hypothetical protein
MSGASINQSHHGMTLNLAIKKKESFSEAKNRFNDFIKWAQFSFAS